jgi:hypothetical protein
VQGESAFLTWEDDHDTLQSRVRAWAALARTKEEYELRRAAVANTLILTRDQTRDLHLTHTPHGSTEIRPEAIERLARWLKGRRLAFMETVARMHRGPETNDPLSRFTDAIEEVVERTGCAIALNHHVGQEVARANLIDMFSGRGGTALPSNSRGVFNVVRDSDKDLSSVRLIHTKPSPRAGRGPELIWQPRVIKEEHALALETVLPQQAAKDDDETLYQYVLAAGAAGRSQRQMEGKDKTCLPPKGLRTDTPRGKASIARLTSPTGSVVKASAKRGGQTATVYTARTYIEGVHSAVDGFEPESEP